MLVSYWSLRKVPACDWLPLSGDAPPLLAAIFPPLVREAMNTTRACGCKSFRSCKLCEAELDLPVEEVEEEEEVEEWTFDIVTGNAVNKETGEEREMPGLMIIQDFVSLDEETKLTSDLDCLPWDPSQSGRRKQNFGPRANFKKRKTKVGNFCGFPEVTRFVQQRFATAPILEDYKPVEQCSIEYKPETGASIEPHIDDCWIWGERIVQLNLLSDTVLTLNPYREGEKPKYNLADVSTYPRVVGDNGEVVFNPFKSKLSSSPLTPAPPAPWSSKCKVLLPLPRRSLLVMWGSARYNWEHSIRRADIKERRIVIAYRELTPTYLPGGPESDVGAEILEQASRWWPQPAA